ncbi:MAG: peptidylprolyl isomerase [Nitrososphaerales archaeon]|jgi:cyclophilin family peptidyl-prolyl cis-trans isomerase
MVNKPRRRKQESHGRTYFVLGVVLVLIAAGVSYAYVARVGPFSNRSTSTTTTGSVLYARINTTKGSFEVELFNSSAPKTVANFVSLADSGFYDNLVWHRIATNPAVIQTGDPLTRNAGGDRSLWGSGNSSTRVPLEVTNSSLHNYAGYLGMARGNDPNSGTCQFYINIKNNTGLDGQYTVFGRVISDLSVVNELAAVQTYGSSGLYPEQPVDPTQAMLLSITILSGP